MPFAEDFYQFRHAMLQQAAYELQPLSSRGRLHRFAVDLLEQAGSLASELARHALAGQPGASDDEKADLAAVRKKYLRRAAEDALAQFRNDECLQFLELVYQSDLSPAEAIEIDCRAAEVLYRLGRGALAVTRADRALDLAHQLGDERLLAQAHAVRGTTCIDSARNREAEAHYRAAVELLRKQDDPRQLAKTLARLSSAVWLAGKPEEALTIAAEAVELSGGTLIPPQVNIINILMQLGRMDEAKARAEPLRSVLEAGDDAYIICMLANTFGILHDYLGEYDAAQAYYERVCAAAREAGIQPELARGLTNLGSVHSDKREYGAALARQAQAEALAREIGDSRICWYAVRGQAETATLIGDQRSAIERNLAAVRLADEAALPDLAVQARIAAGECFLGLHQPADAVEIIEIALASRFCAHQPLYATLGRATLARAYHRLGRDGSEQLVEAERVFTQVPDHGREEAAKALKIAQEELLEREA